MSLFFVLVLSFVIEDFQPSILIFNNSILIDFQKVSDFLINFKFLDT